MQPCASPAREPWNRRIQTYARQSYGGDDARSRCCRCVRNSGVSPGLARSVSGGGTPRSPLPREAQGRAILAAPKPGPKFSHRYPDSCFSRPCAGRSRRLTEAGGPLLNCSIKTPCSTWETDMKLSVAVIMILSTVLLYPSSGFSQQAAGSPQPGGASAGRTAQPVAPFLCRRSPPANQERAIGLAELLDVHTVGLIVAEA